jgi:hypothetical protein
MPLKFGKMMDVPEELKMETDAMDESVGEELASMTPPPERPFSPKVMTALASAISAVLGAMGIEAEVETYTEPVPQLDPDEVRFLAMLTAAAADYGKPLPVTPDKIRSDSDLTAITAALRELAKDSGFADFLGQPEGDDMGEDGTEVEVEVKAKPAPGGKGGKPGSEDDLFMSRMRK